MLFNLLREALFFLNAGALFWLLLFVGITFHKKIPIKMCTMSLPVITTIKDMKEKKRIKVKIGVGSVVEVKVRDMEENKRDGRTRMMMKYVVECVQYVSGRKRFEVRFEHGKKKDMSSSSLLYVCEK